jgi:hypothetical protein
VTGRPGGSGTDPIGEFQQWLVRSGAREVGRGLRGRIRATLGLSDTRADVWERATTGPPPGEAPECAWCPVCRAARLLRESGPGVGSQVAAAGEALAVVVQDAVSAVEAALAAAGRAGAAAEHAEHAGPGPAANAGGATAEERPGPGGAVDAEDVAPGPQGATGWTATGQAESGQHDQSPVEEPGQADQGRRDAPRAGQPPEGSPHEPDDRG